MPPMVSVLIPSHRMEFLGGAMGSVFRQTFTDYELLIDYQRAPMGDRLNRLGSIAHGTWLMMLGDDDELLPDYLKTCMSFVINRPAVGVIYTDVLMMHSGEIARMKPWTFESFRVGPPCWVSSLVRADLWRKIDGHHGELMYHDYDFWYRCFLTGTSAIHVPEPLWKYREHPGQWSYQCDRPLHKEIILQRHPELR